jgi:excinuclease ABC subunit C
MTRKMFKDHAKYYGPFTDVTSLKEVIELIHELWPIRKCSKNINDTNAIQRPCLNYHIGQCMAPCNRQISQTEYKKFIDEAMGLLDGKYTTIIEDLQRQMLIASEELNFEKAAEFRNKINSIKAVSQRQKMINASMEDQDVFAFARAHGEALVQVFLIRAGKLIGREHFMLDSTENMTRAEVMTEFIKQFYNGTPFIPKEIILQEEIEDMDIIQTWLSSIKESKVYITVPQKGEKNKLVELAAKNAMITLEQFGEKIKRDIQKTTTAVSEIKDLLGLDTDIKRMEAYDISNIQGFESVGSMVVFELGKPKRSDYRKFKIKSVVGPNDYASMEEVLTRRFAHALKEIEELKQKNIDVEEGKFTRLPDLIMMDGGKGQVNIAKKVLEEFKLNIQVCGMIKDDNHKTRGLIYEDQELMIPSSTEGFKLITRIQDEVHRFAIEYHRTLRADKQLHSILDDIPGIGIKRRKALLKHFGSVEHIKNAELSELLNVDTMDKRSAEAVFSFFNGKDK